MDSTTSPSEPNENSIFSYDEPSPPPNINTNTETNYSSTTVNSSANPPATVYQTDEYTNNNNNNKDTTADAIPINRSIIIFCLCASLNSCNLGFDIGVSTVVGPLLQDGDFALSDFELEIFMGFLNFFAMLGAVFASNISDRFGRRRGFTVAAMGFIFGVLVMSSAPNYVALMFGRSFVGIGVGFGLAIDPLYISEISPASHRGRLVTWSEIATNLGIVLGFSSALFFINVDSNVAWRLMFLLGAIMPSCLIFLTTFVMPESPRWLVSKDRLDEAREVLTKIYPPSYDVNIVIQEIQDSLKIEEEAQHMVGWDQIFSPSPAIKRMLIVGVGAAVAQQLVGIDAIQYFLQFILEEVGVEDRSTQILILIGLGILKLAVIFYAGRLLDTRGRRPMLFASLLGMTVSFWLVSISFINEDNNGSKITGIFGLACFLAFFSLGLGPGAWLIPSEVFAIGIRAKAMSIATFMNRATATFMSSTFLTIANTITYSVFFIILSLVCLAVLIFFRIYLPETTGKSLEDMSLYFAQITGDNSILDAEKRLHESANNSSTRRPEEGAGIMT